MMKKTIYGINSRAGIAVCEKPSHTVGPPQPPPPRSHLAGNLETGLPGVTTTNIVRVILNDNNC
jgi:hypothetical protein